ncbi:MAG: WD40 repeat domain-containing protein [Planctomycetota bacterium]
MTNSLKQMPIKPLSWLGILIVFVLTLGDLASARAQSRTYLDGYDPSKSVVFEAPKPAGMRTNVSPDGKLRAEAGFQKLEVSSVEDKEMLFQFRFDGHAYSPTFTPDGKQVVAAVCRGNLGCISTLYAWDLESGKSTTYGECSGLVLDIAFDADGERLAVATAYGRLGAYGLYSVHKKWFGGEIVVFDRTKDDQPLQIFCELSGVMAMTKDHSSDEATKAKFDQSLEDACKRCLPVRVGLTGDGKKVIGVTSAGTIRVFDAMSGKSDLQLSRAGRGGSEHFVGE